MRVVVVVFAQDDVTNRVLVGVLISAHWSGFGPKQRTFFGYNPKQELVHVTHVTHARSARFQLRLESTTTIITYRLRQSR